MTLDTISGGIDPIAATALGVSVLALALVTSGASALYTRRQASAAERSNALQMSARLRVIVRDRRELRGDGMFHEPTVRWEIHNAGRVTAHRVVVTLELPGWRGPNSPIEWKFDALEPSEHEVIDFSRLYIPGLVDVAKSEHGLDAVYALAKWRDDREGVQTAKIEIEQLDEVHPVRADGEQRPL